MCAYFLKSFSRKKVICEAEASDLQRCLSTYNLISLGVGSTLGAGAYVLSGSVAREDSGPSIIVSFAVAAFASLLAGLCYAEFGARVPKAGSAYIYSYVTVGELWGFIIGWNLILEYVIGVSSVARAWSANLDALTGGAIANATRAAMPMNIHGFAPYPDFLSVGIILIITVMLSIGMQLSSIFMSILTAFNVVILLFCTVFGFVEADPANWNVSASPTRGSGGFMPYGFSKMMEGAATCFYAFVGFDTIACVGEEARNPSKSIPRSILATLLICLVAYVGVSAALTLMQPYYLLDVNAPLPEAFRYIGQSWAAKPVAVGSMCALIASCLGAAVGMPRIVFAMARDGLIFKFFAKVSSSGTPVPATIASGLFSGLMAAIFDLADLVNMMSIGTLMAYTLVVCSVLLLRYSADDNSSHADEDDGEHAGRWSLLNPRRAEPNVSTTKVVLYSISLSAVLILLLCVLLVFGTSHLTKWWGIMLVVLLSCLILFLMLVISRQPQSQQYLHFKTPLVPLVPFTSLFFNVYLMLKLPSETWMRFGVWMIAGFLVYFGYGIRHSKQGIEDDDENTPLLRSSSSRTSSR